MKSELGYMCVVKGKKKWHSVASPLLAKDGKRQKAKRSGIRVASPLLAKDGKCQKTMENDEKTL